MEFEEGRWGDARSKESSALKVTTKDGERLVKSDLEERVKAISSKQQWPEFGEEMPNSKTWDPAISAIPVNECPRMEMGPSVQTVYYIQSSLKKYKEKKSIQQSAAGSPVSHLSSPCRLSFARCCPCSGLAHASRPQQLAHLAHPVSHPTLCHTQPKWS